MARITVEDCIDKFESRFELVLVAANRSRKLHSGENATVEKDNDKNTVIALREIADETISIDVLKEKLVEEYQTVSQLDEEELSIEHSESDNSADTETEDTQLSEINVADSSANIENDLSDVEHISDIDKTDISKNTESVSTEDKVDDNVDSD